VASVLVIAVLVAVALWWGLRFREQNRQASGQPHHSGLRLVFATFGVLLVLFSGGCGAFLLYDELTRSYGGGGDNFMSWQVVAVFSLPPLSIGALIWWVSMRRNSG
jgi:hypothetical protein